MVDGKEVVIEPKELDEFFADMVHTPPHRIYTPREQAIIIEGYKRGVNKDDLAARLGTSRSTMRRWYQSWKANGGKECSSE
jgi:transposase-like protein